MPREVWSLAPSVSRAPNPPSPHVLPGRRRSSYQKSKIHNRNPPLKQPYGPRHLRRWNRRNFASNLSDPAYAAYRCNETLPKFKLSKRSPKLAYSICLFAG